MKQFFELDALLFAEFHVPNNHLVPFQLFWKQKQRTFCSGAERALLLFPEELERNEVVVRDMKLREQKSIQLEKLLQITPEELT